MYEMERQVYDDREEAERKRMCEKMRELRKAEKKKSKERQKRIKKERSLLEEKEGDTKRHHLHHRHRNDDGSTPTKNLSLGLAPDRDKSKIEKWEALQGLRIDDQGRARSIQALGAGDLLQDEDDGGMKLIKSGRRTDVVCIDGSRSADKALQHAFVSMPKSHSLLLLHGIYSPSSVPVHPSKEVEKSEHHYDKMCKRAGRDCHFVQFNYKNNREFGERVCQYQNYNNVKSIIMGKRANASNLRRTLMGSSSQSVMDQCDMPVTIVSEKESDVY